MTTQAATQPLLEPHVVMPRGGLAARCQRVKRDGQQCGRAAREGHRTCGVHGAGYSKREENGTRKKTGRPTITGVYSTTPLTTFAEIQNEVSEMEGALDNSDADLIALKGLLRLLLARLEAHLPKLPAFESIADELEALLAAGELTPSDARSVETGLRDARRVVTEFTRLVREASDVAQKNVAAHLARATTATRVAEQKGVAAFVELCQTQRAIIAELAPSVNWIDAYESALRRQVYGPKHLELPKTLPPLEHSIDAEIAMVEAQT